MSSTSWLQTASGERFDPLDPDPAAIEIRDIAYVLAGEWRFGGHCRPRLSVAQHSVLVSERVPEADALWGLLHDASEAYVRDLNRPIKHANDMAFYRHIETQVMLAVAERFDLEFPLPASVHEADNRVMATEARLCMRPMLPGFFASCRGAAPPVPYEDLYITPWTTGEAEERFLHRFAELDLLRRAGFAGGNLGTMFYVAEPVPAGTFESLPNAAGTFEQSDGLWRNT